MRYERLDHLEICTDLRKVGERWVGNAVAPPRVRIAGLSVTEPIRES